MNKAGFTITAVTRSFGRLLLIALLAFSPAAWAITLQEAKQQGVVGEQRDGYLGLVNSAASAEVQALIDQVNRERRERYQQIAQQNGISVAQVQALFFEQAVEATQAGHYLQNASGGWVKK
jgi:uncharacterized protein YdbL (DUF1318 family)